MQVKEAEQFIDHPDNRERSGKGRKRVRNNKSGRDKISEKREKKGLDSSSFFIYINT
jgi:hypothetical protein